jgi:hypothetical protein
MCNPRVLVSRLHCKAAALRDRFAPARAHFV